jgi:DNA invertase Pin-like site-specific DNA recombinase
MSPKPRKVLDSKTGKLVPDEAGVDRQEKDCRARAKRDGYDVVGVYCDLATSAYKARIRPEYERMLADVEAGLIDVIIVYSADRLYRRLADLEQLVRALDNRVQVVALQSGDIDLSTADGRMLARMLGAAAQRESEKMAERISRAALERAYDGTSVDGRDYFGYCNGGRDLVPVEADAIRSAVEQVLAGVALNQIAKDWKAAGIGHHGVRGEAVHRVLRRPDLAGLSTYKGKIVGTLVDHPAIITPEQHYAIVAFLNQPSRRCGVGKPSTSLLGEIMTCDHCDEPLSAQSRRVGGGPRSPKRRIPIYGCRAGGSRRDREPVDAAITELVLAFLAKNAGALRKPVKKGSGPTSAAASEAQALRDKLAAMPALLAGDAAMNPADYAAAVNALRERLHVVESQLAVTSSTPAAAALIAHNDIRAAWNDLPMTTKRTIIRELIAEIRVGRNPRLAPPMDNITITWATS